MRQYLLPCGACGRKISVDQSQAGLSTTCECGAPLEVPTMRGLADLEQVDSSGKGRDLPKAAWGPPQGLMFLGAVILCIGLAALAYVYSRRPIVTIDRDMIRTHTDTLTPTQSWELWQEFRKGLDALPTPVSAEFEYVMRIHNRRFWASVALAVLGAALLLCGLTMRLQRSAPPRRG